MGTRAELATAVVSSKGAHRVRRQHPWVYRTDLVEPPVGVEGGAVVAVVDPQKNPLGQAFYAAESPIALRMVSRRPAADEAVGPELFASRMRAALARRASLQGRDAFRLIHGEADLLPGLFVDRYADALVVQTLSEGADRRKEAWAATLAELTGARRVLCRDDGSGRDYERLPRERRVLWGNDSKARAVIHEGPHRLEVDLLEDFKTGSFLDQVDNHLRAGQLASGEALDCFSYHGGFALALSERCTQVLAVEQDEAAAARARANAELNGRSNVKVENANAFDLLRQFDREGRSFDCIVLDPPGFAKRKEGLATALRAYHELNLRALKRLRPDGLLVTCSCSGRLSRDAFEQMVLKAAADAKRPIQVLERRGAGIDHPVLAALPETEYLKALFVRAL